MLRFAVHDTSGAGPEFSLEGVMLFDQEDLVVPGTVEFVDGHVECRRHGSRAVGLGLLFDTGSSGKLSLQTCLLPDRNEPYRLLVELARHRIAIFLVKSEEWQMLDLSDDHPAMQLWESARQHLTRALVTRDPVVADEQAMTALNMGIEASERLAMAHAEILLHRRYASRAASKTSLGVRVHSRQQGATLKELVGAHFDLLTIPMRWAELQPKPGSYDWSQVDAWLAWAQDSGKKVIAGPLVDLNPGGLPNWLIQKKVSSEELGDLAYGHVEQVVHRYGDAIGMYCTTSGLNTNSVMQLSRKQMIDIERSLAVLVRQGRRGRKVMIELSQPYGEFLFRNDKALSPFVYIEQLIQEGIRIDAIGLRLLFGGKGEGMAARDFMQIARLLDRFFLLERPLVLTNVGVPAEQPDQGGGWWMKPWTPKQQASWASRLFPLALSRPYIESVQWTDLYDHESTSLDSGGMIDSRGTPRPVLQKLLAMRNKLLKPLGPLSLPRKEDQSTT